MRQVQHAKVAEFLLVWRYKTFAQTFCIAILALKAAFEPQREALLARHCRFSSVRRRAGLKVGLRPRGILAGRGCGRW